MKKGAWVAAIVALVITFFMGWLAGELSRSDMNAAQTALGRTGLPEGYAPSYAVHGAAYGRDSFEQTVFRVEYESEREALFRLMGKAPLWRVAEAGAEDYRRLAETAMWPYQAAVQVADDVVFDAWYYREKAEPHNTPEAPDGPFAEIGQVGRGFEFAVFDRETGLFIFTSQFG